MGVFSYGPHRGAVDIDEVRYEYSSAVTTGDAGAQ
jgi:hypothetical protein